MRREWKKKLKELKRDKIKKIVSQKQENNRKNYWWPTIYCLQEKLFVGISFETMKFKGFRPLCKVNKLHWMENNSRFRTPEHKIDMAQYKEGQMVHCAKCGGLVDFRLWKSATKPQFIDVKDDIVGKGLIR